MLIDNQAGKQLLLEQNRALYCVPVQRAELPAPTIENVPVEPIVEPTPQKPTEGRGGTQHREIQQVIKNIGHDLGFGVSIEAACQVSDGAIDVLLTGENNTIAVEVSVTTSPEHELANLKKCLMEQVDYVLCVSPDDDHRLDIQNLCIEQLPQSQLARIAFLNPQEVPEYLSQFDERETTLIRGYEVVTKTVPSDPRDVAYRKSRIKQVLAGKFE